MDLNSAIEKWCDGYLKVPLDYEDDKQKNISDKLVYRDHTSCSTSYSFQNIYLSNNNTYIVYAECGCTDENRKTCYTVCKNCTRMGFIFNINSITFVFSWTF